MANWIPPMNSPARKETDSLLEDLEKRIKQEYEQAAKEVQKKADSYFKQFAKQDAAKQAAVKSGEITQEAYDKWRVAEIMKGKRYTDMINDLSATAVNADKAAMQMVSDSMPKTFAINANYAAYEVERATGIDTNFALYNRDSVARLLKDDPKLLPDPRPDSPTARKLAENKDLIWNRQHMNSSILQGILQGDSMDGIAKRLTSVTDMDSRAAIRNARTMTTAAENAGSMHSYKRAEEMGIKGKKMWMATHDNRTRESHAMMDGETRDLDEAFSNGLQEPGDMSVDMPEEVYNCRCRVVYVSSHSQFAKHYDEKSQTVKIDGKSYATWKQESYEKWVARHEKESVVSVDFGNAKSILGDNIGNANDFAEKIDNDNLKKFNSVFSKAEFVKSTHGSYYDPVQNNIAIDAENAEGSTVFHEGTHWFDYNQNYTLTSDYGHVKYNTDDDGNLISREWVPDIVTIKENAGFSEYVAWEWDKDPFDFETREWLGSGSHKDLQNFVKKVGTSDTYGYDRTAKNINDDLKAISKYLNEKGISRSDPDFVHLSDFMSAISYDAGLQSLTTGGHDYNYWTRQTSNRVAEITASYNVLKSLGREDMLAVERDLAPNLMELLEKEWKKIW